jgi:hypothetical protein
MTIRQRTSVRGRRSKGGAFRGSLEAKHSVVGGGTPVRVGPLAGPQAKVLHFYNRKVTGLHR